MMNVQYCCCMISGSAESVCNGDVAQETLSIMLNALVLKALHLLRRHNGCTWSSNSIALVAVCPDSGHTPHVNLNLEQVACSNMQL